MGACLSSPAAGSSHPHETTDKLGAGGGATSDARRGRRHNAHDSVHSMDTSAERDSTSTTAPVATAAPQDSRGKPTKLMARLKASKQQQPTQQAHAQAHAQAHSSSKRKGMEGGGTAATSQQQKKKKKRPVNIDMGTGQPIPDFSVQGRLDVLHELGSGGSGVTYLCRDLETHKLVAVKFVDRPLPKAAIPFMMREVEVQAQLGEGHASIVTMRELLLTRTHLGLVMDFASGGSLTEQVGCLWESALQRGGMFMSEQEACYFLRQFASAIEYCHRHKVAHRDLKLDNTLLDDRVAGPPFLKICDFGFAKAWHTADDNMKTAIGTPTYMAPQMLAAKQTSSGYSGQKADMWAAGVLMFVMLLGEFPFDHDPALDPNSRKASDEVWLRQQAKGGWRRHPRAADALAKGQLSSDCVDLLDGLLHYDEDKRLTAAQLLAHPWLQTPLTAEHQAAWDELQQEQQAVTQLLTEKRDPHVIRLRKQAMLGMLAISSKPPCKHSLYLHGDLSAAASGGASSPTPADAAAAARAAAQQPLAAAAAAALAVWAPVTPTPHPDSAPSTPTSRAPAAAGAASWPPDDSTNISPAAAAAAKLAATFDGSDSGVVESQGPTHHLSFQAGEGLRSLSLEQRVEVHRTMTAELRAARMAASAQEQQPADSSNHGGGGAAAAAAAADGGGSGAQSPLSTVFSGELPPMSGSPTAAAAAATAAAVSPAAASKGVAAGSKQAGGGWGVKLKSPFAGGTRSSGPAGALDSSDDDEWDDTPDEVWRLPLTSTADPAAYKLSPELAVAAGALVRQLQKSGRVEGRGRTNRSSCPVNL